MRVMAPAIAREIPESAQFMMDEAVKVDSAESFVAYVTQCRNRIHTTTGDRMLATQMLEALAAWVEDSDFLPLAFTSERYQNPWTIAAMLIVAGIEYD
jgi:hypothetical protein